MTMKMMFLASVLAAAAITPALADSASTSQDHHCKLTDGSFDATKTHKQCTTAKGEWAKDVDFTGKMATNVTAIGGETTGVTLDTADKQTYDLDLHKEPSLIKLADELNGKQATVSGYVTTVAGTEMKNRKIVVVTKLKPGK